MEEAKTANLQSLQSSESPDLSLTPTASHAGDSSSFSLRRSARPKPSPQSLRSSPPAIKFYESTRLSSSSAKKPKSSMNAEGTAEAGNTSSLRLRLSQRSPSPKAKVVKLMMPQVETEQHSPTPARNLPTLAPKPSTTPSVMGKLSLRLFGSSTASLLSLEEPTSAAAAAAEASSANIPASSASETAASPVPFLPASQNEQQPNKSVEKKSQPQRKSPSHQPATAKSNTSAPLINDDHCAACNGTGNFICCDSCPKSFHFTCAEPPLDPNNLPENDWFCSECQAAAKSSRATQVFLTGSKFDHIWREMFAEVQNSNPKCFVMPKRFRNGCEEAFDATGRIRDDILSSNSNSNNNSSAKPPSTTSMNASSSTISNVSTIVLPNSSIVTPAGIKAPSIAHLKSTRGFCHACNRLGLTRRALESDEAVNVDARHSRPLLSCSICPLYFHLDCLDPPMASLPPASQNDRWCCPVHFSKERCLALEIAEPLVSACYLLPESAIKLQFAQKRQRILEEAAEEAAQLESEEERLYNCSKHIEVPAFVKQVYGQL